MNKTLISIITINYNNACGLQKTINSLKQQSFENYEYIIIDGGSSDESPEIIKNALQQKDFAKHISYWCSEKDKGIYNAMNKGISHAGGTFIYMLNSGDTLVNNCLDQLSPYLQQNPDSVVYGAIDCYKNNVYQYSLSRSADDLYTMMIPHQGTFIPKAFHDKYGLYNEDFKIVADREFMVRLKKAGITFIHIPVIVCIYNLEGISSQNSKIEDRENLAITNSFISERTILLNKIRHVFRVIIEILLPGFISIPLILLIRKLRQK